MFKNTKKIRIGVFIFVLSVIFFTLITSVNAEEAITTNYENETEENTNIKNESVNLNNSISGVVDSKLMDGVYKFSENNVPYLPFIRYATDRILVDKEIGGTGILMSAKSIEVTSETSGIQVLFSNDATRISAPMEYVIIFGANSVTIDSTIKKDVFIYGSSEVTITENGKVNGNIICNAGTVNVKGTVSGSIIGQANDINITGKVEKDLRVKSYTASLQDESTVKGCTYIETYNKDLKLDDKFNANINYLEIKKSSLNSKSIINGIVTSLIFALIYLILIKKNDGKTLDIMLNKTKSNSLFVIMSSAIFLIIFPVICLLLLILALVGLYAVAVPALIAIVSIFTIECLLSTFIVGSVIVRYMDKNYFAKRGLSSIVLGAFIIYFTLYILARVPVISGYVVLSMIILSTGIVLTLMFRKDKITLDDNKRQSKK